MPPTSDAYESARETARIIERETSAAAAEAEQEWERVTRQYGTKPFSAKPTVDLRPGANGLDVVVRYITRAPQRFDVKSRLFQSIVELLHKPAQSATPAS